MNKECMIMYRDDDRIFQEKYFKLYNRKLFQELVKVSDQYWGLSQLKKCWVRGQRVVTERPIRENVTNWNNFDQIIFNQMKNSHLGEEINKYLLLVAEMELLKTESVEISVDQESSSVSRERLDSEVDDGHDDVTQHLSQNTSNQLISDWFICDHVIQCLVLIGQMTQLVGEPCSSVSSPACWGEEESFSARWCVGVLRIENHWEQCDQQSEERWTPVTQQEHLTPLN